MGIESPVALGTGVRRSASHGQDFSWSLQGVVVLLISRSEKRWSSPGAPWSMKGSVQHVDLVPLFGRLFRGRYKSLAIGFLKSGASLRLALGGSRDGRTTLEGRSQQ